jgi:sulfur carrier protein
MTLTINGRTLTVPETIFKVSDLMTYLGIDKKVTVVEVNHEIIDKSKHAEQKLTNGDRVEIVHFVGGG